MYVCMYLNIYSNYMPTQEVENAVVHSISYVCVLDVNLWILCPDSQTSMTYTLQSCTVFIVVYSC